MIDQRAIIDSNAEIAPGVVIAPYTIIGPHVYIAKGCTIGSFVSISGPTWIGENNNIAPFCSIGSDPQDKKYKSGAETILRIGAGNTIREYCSINRGTAAGAETVVGNNNWIMANVHIAHDCVIADNCVLANHVSLSGHVLLDDYVTLSGYSGVAQFCHIGAHAFAAANAAIDRHVPPFVKIAGDRARYIGVNSQGLSRRDYSEQQISVIKKILRQFYRKPDNHDELLRQIHEIAPDEAETRQFIEFMDSVKDSHLGMVLRNSPSQSKDANDKITEQAQA